MQNGAAQTEMPFSLGLPPRFGLRMFDYAHAAGNARRSGSPRRIGCPFLSNRPSFIRSLWAIQAVRREDFVPRRVKRRAYDERPQDIGYGQTISDPYLVAVMTAAGELRPGSRVLEIGTGLGYQAAIVSRLARELGSIGKADPLAKAAAARLKHLGYKNILVRSEDGFFGWSEKAPSDAILVTAGEQAPKAARRRRAAWTDDYADRPKHGAEAPDRIR